MSKRYETQNEFKVTLITEKREGFPVEVDVAYTLTYDILTHHTAADGFVWPRREDRGGEIKAIFDRETGEEISLKWLSSVDRNLIEKHLVQQLCADDLERESETKVKLVRN